MNDAVRIMPSIGRRKVKICGVFFSWVIRERVEREVGQAPASYLRLLRTFGASEKRHAGQRVSQGKSPRLLSYAPHQSR